MGKKSVKEEPKEIIVVEQPVEEPIDLSENVKTSNHICGLYKTEH